MVCQNLRFNCPVCRGRILFCPNLGQSAFWLGMVSTAAVILRLTRWLISGLLALTLTAGASGSTAPSFADDYQAENWGLDEGFPENSCTGIVFAPDGYMWLGTFRGLVRFNGQTFRPWAPAELPALRTATIMRMHQDLRGRIWISTLEGLVMFEAGRWRRWSADEGWHNPADPVRSIADSSHGDMAFGRASGKVLRFDGTRFSELPEPPGTGGTFVALDGQGQLHFSRSGRAGWLKDNQWEILELNQPAGSRAAGATQTLNGDVAVICSRELLRLRGGRIVQRVPLSRHVGTFWQSSEEADGSLWLSLVDTGICRIRPDGTVNHFAKTEGLPFSGGARVVQVGENGSVWVGSTVGGLTRLKPARFRYIGSNEGLPDREIVTLTQLADGRMLFAPYGVGLQVFDGSGVQPFRTGLPIPLLCRALLRGRDNTLWLGSNGAGLHRLADQASTRVTHEATPANGQESFHTLFEDSQGRIWAGGDHAVIRGDAAGFTRVGVPADRRPTLFAERRDGTVLIGQHGDLFALARGGDPATPTRLANLPPDARISSLLVDARDRVWVATAQHGLHVFADGRLIAIPPSVGLPGNSISALVQDNDGRIWFGSNRHVVRAQPDELLAAAENPGRDVRLLTLNRDDGLRHLDFTYGTQPNVLKDAQGRLWFAMIRGVAVIDPNRIRVRDLPPPVVIESLSYVPAGREDRITLLPGDSDQVLQLPAGSRSIRIDYAALDFASPRKQRFQVDLNGRRQDVRADTSATFLELPPGPHTFHVAASGSDGSWNREGARVRFVVTPHVWQTAWFQVGTGLFAASLVAGSVWYLGDRRTRRAREKLEKERTLAQAQARLAHVLENTSDVVAFFDPAGVPLYLNQAGRAHLGLAPGQRELKDVALFAPWAETIHRSHALPRALGSGSWTGELSLMRRGEELPVSALFVAHRDAQGTIEFVSMIARDISAAKRHAEVQETLRTLATDLSAAVGPLHLGRAVAVACRALFRHEGFFLATVRGGGGSSLHLCHAEDERGAFAAGSPEMHAIEARIPKELGEVLGGQPLLVADRPDVPCRIGHEPRRSGLYAPILQSGQVVGLISIQGGEPGRYRPADLAQLEMVASQCVAALARIHAEERLKSNEEHLRRSQKLEAIGTLAGGIAHDFNNILAGIIGWLGVARPSALPGTVINECLDNIERSSLRARDLVRRILAFSRTQETRLRVADAAEVAAGVGKLLRASAPRRIRIEVESAPDLPPANIDPTELHQVLLNLGTNAVQSIGNANGSVLIRLARSSAEGKPPGGTPAEPGIRITVEDTGSGIPAEILPRIFDPFFTTKAVGQGTGLGLSVAHGIVKSSGGTITVVSSPGSGSTFTVLLPASAEPAPAATPAPASVPAPARPSHHRIMLVDDEPAITLSLSLLLRRDGNEVIAFDKPDNALEAFRKEPHRFDLVLTDYSMPQMTGLELATAVHALAPSVPILMMTGYAQSLQRDTVRAAGIAKLLDKPIEGPQLFRAVTQALRREPITD